LFRYCQGVIDLDAEVSHQITYWNQVGSRAKADFGSGLAANDL
jgi:hypothetical protein